MHTPSNHRRFWCITMRKVLGSFNAELVGKEEWCGRFGDILYVNA
jgi:hypothetical protein